jgi:hypothetical protein
VARSAEFLLAVNLMCLVYVLLITVYLVHAQRNMLSPLRWRLAMWTDLVCTALVALADSSITSPAYLVLLAVILGNGMRYGLRPFGEAALGSFLLVLLILYLRFTDYMSVLSVAGIFYPDRRDCGVVRLLLMARLEQHREEMAAQSNLDMLTGLPIGVVQERARCCSAMCRTKSAPSRCCLPT